VGFSGSKFGAQFIATTGLRKPPVAAAGQEVIAADQDQPQERRRATYYKRGEEGEDAEYRLEKVHYRRPPPSSPHSYTQPPKGPVADRDGRIVINRQLEGRVI